MRKSREIYVEIRSRIETFIREYTFADGVMGEELMIMGNRDQPDQLFYVRKDGESGVRPCPPILEGDGQVVWMVTHHELPCVVVSNDRDTELLLGMNWYLSPKARDIEVFHMRCNKRLTTFLNSPPPVFEEVNVGEKRGREDYTAVSKSKKAKTTFRIYDYPFADINRQMVEEFESKNEFLSYMFLAIMCGCDYVVKDWVKGISGDYILGTWTPNSPIYVNVSGNGPYTVEIDRSNFSKFLNHAFKVKNRKIIRSTQSLFEGAIRRSLWTMIYMVNQFSFPEDVPDCLLEIDGVSVWGWEMDGGRVRTTNDITTHLPEDSLGVQ